MNNQKQYMLLLLKFFLIIHKTLILQGFRLLWNKNKRDRKMRNALTHLMVSDTFYFIVDDIVFCPKDDKPYCPLTFTSFKLFPIFLSTTHKCWYFLHFRHLYFAKYRSFRIVFKVFSSKLVAVSAPIIFHRLDIIYFFITHNE